MRLIALLVSALLLVTGCSSGGGGIGDGGGGAAATRVKSEYDPRLADKTQFGRLVIAHINLGKPSRAYLAEHEERIDALVADRLRAAGYQLQPGTEFEQAWREGVRKWGEPYNPTTGKLNVQALQYVLAEAVTWLAANTQAQGVVFTNLEEQQVYFNPSGNHMAYFMGVGRKPATRGGEGITGDFNWVQGVDAVSINIKVLDLKLQQLFSGAGGIEVTETLDLKGSTPRWMRSKKILDNEDFIEEGINLALDPWIKPD
jgi:hypothetical protein